MFKKPTFKTIKTILFEAISILSVFCIFLTANFPLAFWLKDIIIVICLVFLMARRYSQGLDSGVEIYRDIHKKHWEPLEKEINDHLNKHLENHRN